MSGDDERRGWSGATPPPAGPYAPPPVGPSAHQPGGPYVQGPGPGPSRAPWGPQQPGRGPGYPGSPWQVGPTPQGPPPQGPWPPAPSRPDSGSHLGWGLLVGAVLLALVAGVLGGVTGAYLASDDQSTLALSPGAGATSRPEGSIANIAAKALPSVVTLKVRGNGRAGTGSGFIVREDGYLLTNNHVVSMGGGDTSIIVQFSDGTQERGKVVGSDASYDLAVVKVEEKGLPTLTFGSSRRVAVGDPVIAVGAPLGLESTVTSGIVSALNRPVSAGDSQDERSYINAIQTDAAINPGNSGVPLLDGSGRVIGINSAIARIPGAGGDESGSIGVGFAIPSDQARRTAEQLIKTGKAEHPVIGVLLDRRYDGQGVKIIDTKDAGGQDPVVPGGPADKAGLKPGDVILKLDGKPVTDTDELVVQIRAHAIGDVVTLLVRSDGRERTVKMTLEGSG
jgi:putative serine protease PepD